MDEAVVRIRLEGEGGAAQATSTQITTFPRPVAITPPAPAGKRRGDPESIFDSFLGLLQDLRGMLGGIFGPLAGAVLDVVSAARSAGRMAPPPARLPTPPPLPPVVQRIPTVLPAPPGAYGPFPQVTTIPSSQIPVVRPITPPAGSITAPAPTGGGGGEISAAGVIGIVGAVIVATKALRDGMVGATDALGKFSVGLVSASPDPSVFMGHLGSSVSTVSERFFLLNPILSTFGGVLGSAISTVSGFMGEMDRFVDRFAQFSPGIMVAQQFAELRQFFGDLRRAQEVGPALIRYINQRAELQQRFEDAKIRFITAMMPIMLKLMELGEKALPYLELLFNLVSVVAGLMPGIGADLERIRREMERGELADLDPFFARHVMEHLFPFAEFPREGGIREPVPGF